MRKNILTNVGTRIRKWRKSLKIKSFELAKLIHVSQGSLSDLENNKSLPSAQTIANFGFYTDINIWWMLTGNSKEIDTGEMIKAPLTINLTKTVPEVLIKRED